jgi:2-desacetyl-2-hydroxyethyl bacteriochlorophyllide A dehydrogenase
MKALVLEAYNKFEYKDVEDPQIREDEVLVNVKACGICGSDVHGMDGSTGRRIPPLIMGHEASGVIVDKGGLVERWGIGDRVTFDSTVYPLNDWYTVQGHYNLSDNRQVLGVSPGEYKRNGAFAEFVAVPQHILYRIPESVTFVQAAMVEPIAVAAHSLSLSGIKTGQSALVVGAGMIGAFLMKLLKIAGVVPVIALDNNDEKLEQALKYGADHAFNINKENLLKEIQELTKSRGVDVAFEAVGVEQTVNTSIHSLRKGGKAILVGNLTPKINFPLQAVVTRELQVLGSCAINGEYEVALDLLEKQMINVDEQISVVAPLSEGAESFRRLYGHEKGLNKVILVP